MCNRCGDGFVMWSEGEECDDGNTIDGDGCSGECKIETDYTCMPSRADREGPSICKITCIQGWNYYEPTSAFKAYKECDDGNLIEDDGCST
jgi:cysteine-rich repeat protein